VFYKVLDKAEGSEDEAREGTGRIFAQGSHVFNIAQVEGYALPEVPEADPGRTAVIYRNLVGRLDQHAEIGRDGFTLRDRHLRPLGNLRKRWRQNE
jgi:hypothetical protein